MQSIRLFCFSLYFLLMTTSSAKAHYERQPHRARNIFSDIGSLADSVLGISTTQSTDQTTVAASTASQTTITQNGSTSTATPQVVSVVPTATATNPSSQTSATGTSSDATSTSAATPITQSATSSSTSTTTNQPTSQNSSSSSSQTSSTPATPANPLQGLSSGSSGSPQTKQENANSVPAAGVAVAVIFGVLILAGIGYLLYRYFRSARAKTGTPRPSAYTEHKRFSYFDNDAEQGMVHNHGLGLGQMAKLRSPSDTAASSAAQSYETRSRARSEDSLFLESTVPVPVSPLDKHEPPLPPLPYEAQKSWPIISPIDAPYPPSLSVKAPATTTPRSGNAGIGYIPYRRESEPVIGLAVPVSSSHARIIQTSGAPIPASSTQTHPVAAFEQGKRVSGVHELS